MDTDTFSLLVERTQAALRIHIARYGLDPAAVDDVAQEVYLDHFRADGAVPAGVAELAWLKGMARHKAIDHLRRRRSATSTELLAAWPADEAAEEDLDLTALRACLERLPEPARHLLYQRYAEDASPTALAQRHGRSPAAMRKLLWHLRGLLAECLGRRQAGGMA